MFDFAQQAENLGSYLARFHKFIKDLNRDMLVQPDNRRNILPLIGSGRFNRAVTEPLKPFQKVEDATILFTDELRKARSGKHHGLFAAFVAAHHPLLGFAQRLMIDLGTNHGFKCVINHGGQEIAIPLHLLKIEFNNTAQVSTSSDIKVGDKILPKGFVLMDNMSADKTGPKMMRPSYSYCKIVDADNKPLDKELETMLLWTGIAGKGKNIFAKGSPEDELLGIMGIDDMETANLYLIETVAGLQAHGYNPEPLWNEVFKSAREQLLPHLSSMAIARDVIIDSARAWGQPLYHPDAIDNLAEFFGVELPTLDTHERGTVQSITGGLSAAGRR